MGSSRWSPADWTDYASTTKGKARADVFTSRSLGKDLDPLSIKVRESHEQSLPMIYLDPGHKLTRALLALHATLQR